MKTIVIAIACMCGMAVAVARAADLTTAGTVEGRYLVGLGMGMDASVDGGFWTQTVVRGNTNNYRGSDVIEIVSSSGNAGLSWQMNDGNLTSTSAGSTSKYRGGVFNTYGGSQPDYFGYHFKMPAKTVNQVKFWEYSYGDGGPFTAQPDVQYLDAMYGTWQSIPLGNLTFTPAYSSALHSGSVKLYTIDINPPLANVWGIRLYGNAAGSANDDTASIPGNGFVACMELTVYGDVDWNGVDLTRNYAHYPDATGLAVSENAGVKANLIDGNVMSRMDTWSDVPRAEDYIGVEWTSPHHHLAAMGAVLRWNVDGGLFDECGEGTRIEWKDADGNWTAVTGLQKYRYPYLVDDLIALGGSYAWGYGNGNTTLYNYWMTVSTGFLFTFDPVDNVHGLRMIGKPVPAPDGDPDGFIMASEVDVFGRPVIADQVNYDQSPDGDVDAADELLFLSCFSGATVPYATGCADRDLDKDGDVDEDDFGVFQRCFSGPGVAPIPTCGDPVP
jgi:hypothetical protein